MLFYFGIICSYWEQKWLTLNVLLYTLIVFRSCFPSFIYSQKKDESKMMKSGAINFCVVSHFDTSFNDTKNQSILNTTIDYILSAKRFDVPLTNFWFVSKHLCIENMSFKFYNLIVNLFTKFLPYYIIGLGI